MSDSSEFKDLTSIHSDRDWLDLKIADKALLVGKTKFKQGDTSIPVRFPDWSEIIVQLTDERGAQTQGLSFQTSQVEVVVERTEDGLQTCVDDIKFTG